MRHFKKVVFALVASLLLVTAMPVSAAPGSIVKQFDTDGELNSGTLGNHTITGGHVEPETGFVRNSLDSSADSETYLLQHVSFNFYPTDSRCFGNNCILLDHQETVGGSTKSGLWDINQTSDFQFQGLIATPHANQYVEIDVYVNGSNEGTLRFEDGDIDWLGTSDTDLAFTTYDQASGSGSEFIELTAGSGQMEISAGGVNTFETIPGMTPDSLITRLVFTVFDDDSTSEEAHIGSYQIDFNDATEGPNRYESRPFNVSAEDLSGYGVNVTEMKYEGYVYLMGYDGSSWNQLERQEVTSTGSNEWSASYSGYENTRVDLYLWRGSRIDTIYAKSEQLYAPEITNAEPADGTTLNRDTSDQRFNITIEDRDFGTVGDSVTIEIIDNDTSTVLNSTTATSNGTYVIGGVTVENGETLNWYAEARDITGNSTTIPVRQLNSPAVSSPTYTLNSPADGSTSSTESIQLQVDVTDEDYSVTGRSDTQTAEFRHQNGTLIGTDTATANSTLSTGYNLGIDETLTWYVEWNDSQGNTGTTANWTVSGEGSDPPIIVNTYPADGSAQSDLSVDLTVEVSDPDFSSDWGDTVTATFKEGDGSTIGTNSTTSAGNVTTSWSSLEGGSNIWYVELEDQYGNTAQSANQTVNAPDTLSIYNETNATQKLTGVNVTLEFYFDRDGEPDLIVERETSNGEINMTGLPVDEDFVVVASSEGYFNRRIWVPSLFETQSIYLLNESETAVQPTFRLIDFTGRFDRDVTVIEVQRNINGTWQTVEGDFFGAANSMTAQLAYNERHRIIITNTATGESRELGAFTPTATATVELEVHNDDEIINEQFAPTAAFAPPTGSLPADTTNVSVNVGPGSADLSTYYFSARLSNGTELFNVSGSSASGETLSATPDLSGADDQTVTLYLNWTTTEGDSGSLSKEYSISEAFDNDFALVPTLIGADLGGETPNTLSVLLVVFGALFATGFAATEMGSGPAGLIGLGVITLGALIDFIPLTWLVGGVLAWLVMAGVRNRL